MPRTIYQLSCQNPTCGITFASIKRDRKYCCLKCYAATPEFQERRKAALIVARKNYKPQARAGETRPCLHCGKPMYLTKTDIKRGRKTCSRAHYRAYLAARFDRAIAAPVSFKTMQGYDEFLTQDALPCLVEGCDWSGHNLSLHMNQAHGITEDVFKREAGFNLNTGIVSAAMAENLRARGNKGTPKSLDQERATATRGRCEYISKERIEHARKAALLADRDTETGRFRANKSHETQTRPL